MMIKTATWKALNKTQKVALLIGASIVNKIVK